MFRALLGSPSGGAAEVAHTGAEGVSNVRCGYALTDDTSPDLAGARPPSPEGRARMRSTNNNLPFTVLETFLLTKPGIFGYNTSYKSCEEKSTFHPAGQRARVAVSGHGMGLGTWSWS